MTPALPLFCAILIACYARPVAEGRPCILLGPGAAAAAAGIVLLGVPAQRPRRAGGLVAAAGIGLLLGLTLVARMGTVSAQAGAAFPAAAVSSFRGYLTRDSSLTKDGTTLLSLALTGAESEGLGLRAAARGRVLVALAGDYRYSIGQVLAIRSGLRPADPQGVNAFFASVDRRAVSSAGFRRPLWKLRAGLRSEIHRSVSRAGFPASALLEALLVGGVEDVPPALSDGFRRTGSLHVLALSGLQLVVIYGFISLILRPLGSRVLRLVLGTAVLAFYQFIAGPVPSLLRATLMLAAGSAALLLDRDAEPLNLLCLSGTLLLLAEPSQASSLSFQLSFLALAGILLLGPLVSRPLEGRVPAAILEPLAASAGAQIATLPIVLASFGVYYPVGLLAGLVLVPLTTLILWLGLAWLLLCPLLGDLLGGAAPLVFGGLYDLVSGSASFFSRAPGLAVGEAVAPWAAGIAAVAALLLSFVAPKRIRGPRRLAVGAG